MQLSKIIAAAALASSASAYSAGNSTTHTSVAPPSKATGTVAPVTSAGALVPAVKVTAAVEAMASVNFEIREDLCIVNEMPAAAAQVPMRLRFDCSVDVNMKVVVKQAWEPCVVEQRSRVVTEIEGAFYYGAFVKSEVSVSGAVQIHLSTGVVVERKSDKTVAVVEQNTKANATVAIKYECESLKCQPKPCPEEEKRVNVKIEIPAPRNSTAVPVPVQKFEPCVEKCRQVETCVGDKCHVVPQPTKPEAPAPIKPDEVKALPAPPQGNVQEKEEHKPSKPSAAPPAGTSAPKPSEIASGSGRVALACNVLFGVVAMAFFL